MSGLLAGKKTRRLRWCTVHVGVDIAVLYLQGWFLHDEDKGPLKGGGHEEEACSKHLRGSTAWHYKR
eukprot:1928744-Amphidinium_carterae.1